MIRAQGTLRGASLLAALTLLRLGGPPRSEAACNLIPPASETLRAAVGRVSRPFARSGGGASDDVELSPGCDSPTLENPDGDEAVDAKELLVSVFFKPPRGGPVHHVLLTGGAECGDLRCGTEVPHCVAAPGSRLLVDRASGRVRFRFPDTDGLLPPAGDGRTLAGPVAIAVTAAGDPLPCELRTKSCVDQPDRPKRYFCVDDLFVDEAGPKKCDTGRERRSPTFPGFTALPASNDYRRVCGESEGEPSCSGDATSIRMAVDSAGNVGLPMRWGSALRERPGGAGRKDNRTVKGSTAESRKKGEATPIDVPNPDYLASFTAEGRRWGQQPLFEPLSPGRSGRARELTLHGTADELESVLWFHRRMPWSYRCEGGPRAGEACGEKTARSDCGGGACVRSVAASYFTCRGGAREGLPCTRSADCGAEGEARCLAGSHCVSATTGGATTTACTTDAQCKAAEECGPGLFEFRDRMASGVGPIVLERDASPAHPGVCRSGSKSGQSCTSPADCEGKPCVRFRAEAGPYVTSR